MKKIIVSLLLIMAICTTVLFVSCDKNKKSEITITVVKEIVMELDETITIDASYNGEKELSWSVENSEIVSVSNGSVTALALGETIVTVTDGDVSASTSIIVESVDVDKDRIELVFSATKSQIYVGEKTNVNAALKREDKEVESVKEYKSSNNDIVSVTSDGVLTAVGEGSATITVVTEYRGIKLSKSINIVVPKPYSVIADEFIRLDTISSYGDEEYVNSKKISLKVYNRGVEITSGFDIVYKSQNSTIAEVGSDGNVVAKTAGETSIVVDVKIGENIVASTIVGVDVNRVSVRIDGVREFAVGTDVNVNIQELNGSEIESATTFFAGLPVDITIKDGNVINIPEYATNYLVDLQFNTKEITFIVSARLPIGINDVSDLDMLKNATKGYYKLLSDIDMEYKEWSYPADSTVVFGGCFDGNGYKISNFLVDDYGLFNRVETGAKIINMNFENSIVVGNENTNVGLLFNKYNAISSSEKVYVEKITGNYAKSSNLANNGLYGEANGVVEISQKNITIDDEVRLNNNNFSLLERPSSLSFVLTENIDMSGKDWSPSGIFAGELDGQGYAIKNLSTKNGGGLFEIFNGAIKNIALTNMTVQQGILAHQTQSEETIVENVLVQVSSYKIWSYKGLFSQVLTSDVFVKNVFISLPEPFGEDNASWIGFVAGRCREDKKVKMENCYFVSANEGINPIGVMNGVNQDKFIYDVDDLKNAISGSYYRYLSTGELRNDTANFNKMSSELKSLYEKNLMIELNKDNIDILQTATDGVYILTEDIDMSGKDWSPTGEFIGVLDGQGYAIKNLTTKSGKGLFEIFNGTIKNIALTNMTAQQGILAHQTTSESTIIENLFVDVSGYNVWSYKGLFSQVLSVDVTIKNMYMSLPEPKGADQATWIGFVSGRTREERKINLENCYFVSTNSGINVSGVMDGANQDKFIYDVDDFNNVISGTYYRYYSNGQMFNDTANFNKMSTELKSMYEKCKIIELNEDNIDILQTATDKIYVLGEDIDLAGKNWNPTGVFSGMLDGQGYAIKNLKPAADKGLFNTFNGVLKNIAIIDATLTDAIIANNITASGAILEDVLVTIKTETDTTTAGHKQGLFKMLDANGITLKNVYVSLLGEQSDTNGLDAGFVGGLCFDDAVINLINCYFVSANPNTTLSGQAWGGYIQKTENYDNVLTEGSTYSQYASIAALVADSNNVNNMSAQLKALFNKNVEVEVIEINKDNVDLLMTATDGYYKLTEDVYLSGIEWNPTGTFTGALDGQGYSINNLTVTGSANGLFYDFCGYIGNVALTNVKFRQGILAYTTSCSYSKVENVLITCNEYVTWHEKGLFSTVTAGDINLDNVYVMLPSNKGDSADDVSTGFISGTFAEGHKINLNNCYFVDSNTTNVIGLRINITDVNKIPEIVNGNYKIYNSNTAVENDTEYFNGMSQELKALYNSVFNK